PALPTRRTSALFWRPFACRAWDTYWSTAVVDGPDMATTSSCIVGSVSCALDRTTVRLRWRRTQSLMARLDSCRARVCHRSQSNELAGCSLRKAIYTDIYAANHYLM